MTDAAPPRMTLYWSSRSPFVRKVMVAAHELGLAGRIEPVRTLVRATQTNAALLPDNPLSKIPTLVLPDGTTLFDSLVICEYLDALSGQPRLFPAPGPRRWDALTRHALANGLLDVLILWRSEREMPPGQQRADLLAAYAEKTRGALDRLEREVPALAAAPFAIDHLTVGCCLAYLDFRFAALAWREGRPALAAWQAGFEARPSAVATAFVDA